MDDYIQISKLNDFIFCPYSIYLHNIYANFDAFVYHQAPQTSGKLAHETIDLGTYSTKSDILVGLPIFSHKYKLVGKIDTFNKKTGELVERKNKITTIYDGYLLQLYSEYFCLIEMGYKVNSLSFYSISDNKRYKVDLPSDDYIKDYQRLLTRINNFSLSDFKGVSASKCIKCIYNTLCPHNNA